MGSFKSPLGVAQELTSWVSVESIDGLSSAGRARVPSELPERIGPYRVERVLGAGGMGVVYEAVPEGDGPKVAIKTLHGMSPGAVYRFKQEFRRTASLTHTNLIALYELGAQETLWYYAMELLTGPHFLERVWGQERYPGPKAGSAGVLREASALLEALSFLHQNDVLHLDIKPENIRYSAVGTLKLLDFGLSEAAQAERHSGGFSGTPGYMAPEQVWGSCSVASDCYALGVTLYQAVTGRLPWSGSAHATLVAKRERVPPLSSPGGEIPSELCTVIDGLLNPEATQRMTLAEATKALRLEGGSARGSISPTLELFGREAELTRLTELLHQARDRTTLCRVVGDSGVGKSALLRAACRQFRGGPLVLHSRCFQWQSIAFKAVDEIVDQLFQVARDLTQAGQELPVDLPLAQAMFPVLGGLDFDVIPPRPDDPLIERERGLAALGQLVSSIARVRPVLMWVDDAHWGDEESADFLASVAAECPQGLLIVLGSRPQVAGGLISRILDRESQLTSCDLELGPLPRRHAMALARASSPTKSWTESQLDELLRDTDGLPILIERVASFSTARRPLPLSEVVRRQLDEFSSQDQLFALTAVLSTSPVALDDLERACEMPGVRIALSALQAARLLRSKPVSGGELIEPYHDRLRDAVMSCSSPELVRRQSARLAKRLDGRGGSPGQSAELWAQAGQHGIAAERALSAAQRAAKSLAFYLAVDLYERAFAWQAETFQNDPASQEGYAWALYRSGACLKAARVFETAAELHTGKKRWELLSHAVEASFVAGQVKEGTSILSSLLDEVRIPRLRGPTWTLAQLAQLIVRTRAKVGTTTGSSAIDETARLKSQLCWDSGKVLITLSSAEGAVLLLRSLLYALSSGDQELVARGYCLAASGFLPFFHDKQEIMMEHMRRTAREQSDPYLEGMIDLTHGIMAHMSGRWRDLIEHLDRAERTLATSSRATNFEQGLIVGTRLFGSAQLGQGRALARDCVRAARSARKRSDLVAYAAALCQQVYVALMADQRAEGNERLEELRQLISTWSGSYGMWHSSLWQLEIGYRLRYGLDSEQRAQLSAEWRKIESAGLLKTPASRVQLFESRTALLLATPIGGTSTEARRRRAQVTRIARQLEKADRADAEPYAAVLRAALHVSRSNHAAAARELTHAARAYDALFMAERACMVKWQLARLGQDEAMQRRQERVAESLGIGGVAVWAAIRAPALPVDPDLTEPAP